MCTPQKPPKDGVPNTNPDGEPMLYVEYQNGKMHGVQKFLNGVLSEIAYYKNGKLHGEMKHIKMENVQESLRIKRCFKRADGSV